MAKKTTKANFIDYFRAPCPAIDQILLIKKLDANQAAKVYDKLKSIVKDIKPEGAIINYVKTLISELLKDPETLTPYISEDTLITVLTAVYECIVDIYIAFRIEVICADLNDIQPFNPFSNFEYLNPIKDPEVQPSVTDEFDKEFNKILNRTSVKAPSTSATSVRKNKPKKKFNVTVTAKDLVDIESHLLRSVLGQKEAIECLINRIKLISVGFEKRANLFFVGRTGVGKTELAKVFGKKYCNNFAKINCAEFSNGHEVAKLIGAPPGYMGSSQKSFFQEKAEVSNKWVFLFDEIEKAHDKLYNLLLGLLDDGMIVDSNGNQLDFTHSIFIFTSNQGVSELKSSSVGFGSGANQAATREVIMNSLSKAFSPEFRNRIDEFVFFNDLDQNSIREIVKLNLKKYPVHPTSELIEYIVSNAYSLEYGARELNRFLRSNVALPVANYLLANIYPSDGTSKYSFAVENSKLVISNVTTATQ